MSITRVYTQLTTPHLHRLPFPPFSNRVELLLLPPLTMTRPWRGKGKGRTN